MKTSKTIQMNEIALSSDEAKEFILHTLNAQIQYQREKYLREWTRSNNTTEDEKNEKIKSLSEQKEALLQLLNSSSESLDVAFKIELKSADEAASHKATKDLHQMAH